MVALYDRDDNVVIPNVSVTSMCDTRVVSGYDIIGDVHGYAEKLEGLLGRLGYVEKGGAFRHPHRQAIFVGDLIDRGPGNLKVVDIVRAMVEAGTAHAVMGNHEFNAIAYEMNVRPHTTKNREQHENFLREVEDQPDRYAEVIAWFRTLPFWLSLKNDIGIVHACWHESSMDVVRHSLAGSAVPDDQFFERAATEGNELYDAIEVLLKGPEITLATAGLPDFLDSGGHRRSKARIRWWIHNAATLAQLLEFGEEPRKEDGSRYPVLHAESVRPMEHEYEYHGQRPVFFGHYWRTGEPTESVDWNEHAACVDFSAGRGGQLVAYRWSGETELTGANFVAYPKLD